LRTRGPRVGASAVARASCNFQPVHEYINQVSAFEGGGPGPIDFSALYRAHARDVRRFAPDRFSPTGLPCYDSPVHRISSVIRYVWAAPTTALGLVVVLTGLWRAQVRVVHGVVEAHGPALAWLLSHLTLIPGGAAALTLGHVVIARDSWSLESTRAHERVHVRQCNDERVSAA
jgi:hypothetical protein